MAAVKRTREELLAEVPHLTPVEQKIYLRAALRRQRICPRPYIPRPLRSQVYDRDGWKCVECESPDHLTLDHIFPYSLGGEDTLENLQTLCRSCNSRKGSRI